MNVKFLSKSRGIKNLFLRFLSVPKRFGLTSKKFDKLLNKYSMLADRLGCVPTFAITAVTLKRHPELARELGRRGIEFAIHGYIHTDYGVLPLEEQVKHFKRAIHTFQECRLPFTGFRAPFLRTNGQTPQALSHLAFPYDSSHSVHWDVVDQAKYARDSWREYERLLAFYQTRKAGEYPVLPRTHDGFVEIPVSIPDDEAMIERLGITDGREISDVWVNILQRAYDRGELFTLQLHPERISLCETALANVIDKAAQYKPTVWVATLKEIAEWWKQRENFTLDIDASGNNVYQIHANCSERATVLLRHGRVNVATAPWFHGYETVMARDFILESPARPVIGVGPDSSPVAVKFLQSEGYAVEKSDQAENYGLFLSDLAEFQEADEKPLAEKLEKSGAPLLRYWRWPDQARSALSVTGDIDSITLIDFALRIWENSKYHGRF
ncbi:MAG: hypothetical protein A2144_05170 [Chloroflexi bacterium RBG_16_50_9]|nr:MAG: hypothetical protein A2144_05170 [Chloroflexi bacterium RBG_16_50_9]